MAPSSLPAKILVAFSSLLLAHACYSAQEHSSISVTSSSPASSQPASTSAQPVTTSSLPLDITLETLLAVGLLFVGIVNSGWELKPISLRKYAGVLEGTPVAEVEGVDIGKTGEEGFARGRGLYSYLDDRAGFLDIIKQRKEFADWVKEGELKTAMEER